MKWLHIDGLSVRSDTRLGGWPRRGVEGVCPDGMLRIVGSKRTGMKRTD